MHGSDSTSTSLGTVGITFGIGGVTIGEFPPTLCFPEAINTAFHSFCSIPDSIGYLRCYRLINVLVHDII